MGALRYKSQTGVYFLLVYVLLTKKRTRIFDGSATLTFADLRFDVKKFISKISEEFTIVIIWPLQMLGLKVFRYAPGFTFNLRSLHELNRKVRLSITMIAISPFRFRFVFIKLRLIFLFNKMHRLFNFETS